VVRRPPQQAVEARDDLFGDIVLFGRFMRLAYQGVSRIVCGTTPPGPGLDTSGRLNLIFRIL
jgi:hypothetical protein